MALKPCRECQKDVAIGAKSCPNCGADWPAGKKAVSGVVVFFAIALAIVFAAVAVQPDSRAPSVAPTGGASP